MKKKDGRPSALVIYCGCAAIAFLISAMIITVMESRKDIEQEPAEQETEIGLGLEHISGMYYYDKETKIVFLWNGDMEHNNATAPVPYPASNGLPFRWDEKTGTMEEIPLPAQGERQGNQ